MNENKKEEVVAVEKLVPKPRCQCKKNNTQCAKSEDHKGPHMGNDQDFLIIWESK